MDKIALCKLGQVEDGDPVELGSQICGLSGRYPQRIYGLSGRYPHMDIFGGCCGTGHSHLREFAKALR